MILDKEKGLVGCDRCRRGPTYWRHMGTETDDKTGEFVRHLCGQCIDILEKEGKKSVTMPPPLISKSSIPFGHPIYPAG